MGNGDWVIGGGGSFGDRDPAQAWTPTLRERPPRGLTKPTVEAGAAARHAKAKAARKARRHNRA